ncbi:MAG: hypothetical protein ACO3O3_12710 [Ilumatobacteraceae bacterium]
MKADGEWARGRAAVMKKSLITLDALQIAALIQAATFAVANGWLADTDGDDLTAEGLTDGEILESAVQALMDQSNVSCDFTDGFRVIIETDGCNKCEGGE